jgi:hypothetical protein
MIVVFAYSIDPARRLAIVTAPSTVHAGDLAETLHALYLDEAWQAGFSTVWDATAVRAVHVEWRDLQGFFRIQQDHAHLAGPGLEIVVAVRAVDRNLARAYAILSKAGQRRTRVVDSMAEAFHLLEKER